MTSLLSQVGLELDRVEFSLTMMRPFCTDVGVCYFIPENHILEDVNKCVLALQEGDADSLDRTAGAIRGRAARVAAVVTAEMSNYEPGIYTERVLEAVKVLRDQGTYVCF